MDKAEHISKLKSLKIERSNGALFVSSDKCMQWIDDVLPLLKYDQHHYTNFYNHSQYVRITSLSVETLMAHLNPMIGIVSQAITELENNIQSPSEVESVANSAAKAATNLPNHNKEWHDRPLGKVGIGVFIAVIAFLVVYLIRRCLDLAL